MTTNNAGRRANAVGFVVADMAATIEFYRRCGLPIPPDADPTQPHLEVALAGGFRLMFDTEDVARALDPGWTAPTGTRASLAIECDTPTAVDGAHRELAAAGHASHLDPFDAPWGQRYASVLDPDGTPVDFYAPLDG